MSDKSWRDDLGDIAADNEDGDREGKNYIYRVYSSFHELDESGTNEYGYYGSLDKAKKRLLELKEKLEKKTVGYRKGAVEIKIINNGLCLLERFGFDNYYINIEEIEIDKDMEKENIGYT